MNTENIEKFIAQNSTEDPSYVKITFKKRNAIYGMFVQGSDYAHLKSKNFWRIVTKINFDAYRQSRDLSLTRIFNGSEFSRLVSYEESFE